MSSLIEPVVSGAEPDRIEPIVPAQPLRAVDADQLPYIPLQKGERNFPTLCRLIRAMKKLLASSDLTCEAGMLQGDIVIDLKDDDGRVIRRLTVDQAIALVNGEDRGSFDFEA